MDPGILQVLGEIETDCFYTDQRNSYKYLLRSFVQRIGFLATNQEMEVRFLQDRPVNADLAQLVEHLPEEQGVLGAIPRVGTSNTPVAKLGDALA